MGARGCNGRWGPGLLRGRGALLLLAVSMGFMAGAQESGILQFQVTPSPYEYVLDHRFRMQKPMLELSAGTHHFSFWAPEHAVVDTNLVVEAGLTKSIVLRLPHSTDYLVYQRNLQQWMHQRKIVRIIPAAVTGGALLYTGLSYGKMKRAHDVLEQDRRDYEGSTSAHRIAQLKEEAIPAHKEDFRKARNGFITAAGVTVLCAGVTAYLFHRSGRVPRPEFIDREKLRFDGLSWQPGPYGGWTGGLTWNFNR